MKHTLTTALSFCAILSSPAAIVWTGSTSSDPFDDSNWDFSGSSVSAVDSNVSIADDVTITGGNLEIPNLGGQIRFQLGNGFTMTLDNASLNLVAGGNDGVGGPATGATGANINLINGTTFNPFFITNGMALDIDSTSSATFGGGGIPINLSTVNMTSGSVLAFLAETPADFANEHLSKITVDGVAAVDGVNIQVEPFNGAAGSRVTVIPEPSSALLLALGGLALVARRRKS